RLSGPEAVVEQVLRVRVVHRHDRIAERAVGRHRPQPDHAGRRLLRAPEDLADLLGALAVQQAHEVGAVVHGDVRPVIEHRVDVTVVRLVVLAPDREHVDAGLLAERRRDVVLRGERVRGAERDLGPTRGERLDEVGRLGRHVQARTDADALERTLLLEALADQREHAHLGRRPLDALAPLLGQAEVPHVAVHPAPFDSTSAITLPIDRAIAFEARITSSWSTSTPTWFVTKNSPSTRIPSARAGTASGTTDMPTTSAPARRSASISAGVSYDGPGIAAYTPRETGIPSPRAAATASSASSASEVPTISTNGGEPSGRRQPRSGFAPIALMWSAPTTRWPVASPSEIPPVAAVRIAVPAPSSRATRTGSAHTAISFPSW